MTRRAAAALSEHQIVAASEALETVLRNLIDDEELLGRVLTLRRPEMDAT